MNRCQGNISLWVGRHWIKMITHPQNMFPNSCHFASEPASKHRLMYRIHVLPSVQPYNQLKEYLQCCLFGGDLWLHSPGCSREGFLYSEGREHKEV